jgi:hypothetical protein
MVQIPLGAWLFASCICIRCGFLFFILCDLETPTMSWPGPEFGCCAAEEEEEEEEEEKEKEKEERES